MKESKSHIIMRIIRLYMSGRFSAEVEDQVKGWLAEEDREIDKDNAIRAIFDEMVEPDANPDLYVRKSLKKLQGRLGLKHTGVKKGVSYRRLTLKIAAVLLPMIFIGGAMLAWKMGLITTEPSGYVTTDVVSATATDEPRNIVLSDGTEIILDRNSRIVSDGERHVTLSGCAYFDVAKDADRPFVVTTDHMTITVYGTKFDVESRINSDYRKVTLFSGAVKVDVANKLASGKSQVTLIPGTELMLDIPKKAVDVYAIKDSKLSPELIDLEYMRLEDIFDSLGIYFSVSVENGRTDIYNDRYTLRFRKGDSLQEVMEYLQKVSGRFSYEISGDTVKIK